MIHKIIADNIGSERRFELKDVAISRDGSTLFVSALADFRPEEAQLAGMRRDIMAAVPGIRRVDFQLETPQAPAGEEDIVAAAFALLDEWSGRSPWIRAVIREGWQWEEGTLTLSTLGDRAASELERELAPRLSAALTERCGLPLQLHFIQDEAAFHKAMEEKENCLQEEGEELPPPTSREGDDFPDGCLKGRKITGQPLPMDRLPKLPPPPPDEESPKWEILTLAGRIFKLETRTVKKSEKAMRFGDSGATTQLLVSFLFSDKRDSCCAKFFCEHKDWPRLQGEIAEGKEILVRGPYTYDNFLKSPVLMARSINRWQMPRRKDKAERKRLELHAHTKMSAADGLSEPKALVQRAIDWGHPAIAITDHGVVHALPKAYEAAGDKIKLILGTEGYLYSDEGKIDGEGRIDYKSDRTYHIVILVRNEEGRKNLYRLISASHLNYFYKTPRIPRSVLTAHREGLLLGSACQAGELYQAILMEEGEERLEQIASFYDYLEVQPLSNNLFMLEDGRYPTSEIEQIKEYNRKVLALGKKLGKPVVATSDSHYLDPEDNIYREVVRAGRGYDDIGKDGGLYLRTTEEMLEAFDYFSEEDRYDVVVNNPAKINEMIEKVKPVPGREFPRPVIEGAEATLRESCERRMRELYGEHPPEELTERLHKELESIISNHYADLYVAAKMVVEKSHSDGYVVGSRGSVGSSFVAYMSGVSEVNPLAAHYLCPSCHHFEWGDREEYECGVDMPPKNCPLCGTPMERDGYTIPFETFLGFEGDKEPDIDLNFAGEYQARAHAYVDEIFGAENTYKAGTIGKIAEQTAYGFVAAYSEATHEMLSPYEKERLTKACQNVKLTTGQHPGGIVVVPRGHEIVEVCPVQYPANKPESGIVTTHFEYHDYEKALLKLDLLGHDGPTMVRLLHNATGIDPQSVPLNDEKVLGLFLGTEPLDIRYEDYGQEDGSFGIPEFGTDTARGMLRDSHPARVADLVRLSGLGHGEGVWGGNARDLIQKGVVGIGQVIATRDDIMTYLIAKGVPASDAFNIMESVRRGKGIPAGKEELMRAQDVPEWYIDSCEKIQYMFPRGHAAAYVIMSLRIAYFKVYHPQHFYAARLTTKVASFPWDVVRQGIQVVRNRLEELAEMIQELKKTRANYTKPDNERITLEIVYEMMARGYDFAPPAFGHSAASIFTVEEDRVVVPLSALEGVGESAAESIHRAYEELPFATVEDIQVRGKANKTALDSLRHYGLLEGMAESNQLSFL